MTLISLHSIRHSLPRVTVWRGLALLCLMMLPFMGSGHYSANQTGGAQICSGASNQPLEQYPSPDQPLECQHDCGLCCASLLDLAYFPEILNPLVLLMGILVGLKKVVCPLYQLHLLPIRGPPISPQ